MDVETLRSSSSLLFYSDTEWVLGARNLNVGTE